MTVTHPLFGVQNMAQIVTLYTYIHRQRFSSTDNIYEMKIKCKTKFTNVDCLDTKFCSTIKLTTMCMFVLSSFWDTPFL